MEWLRLFESFGGAAVGASAGLAYAVRFPASSILAPSVYRGVRTRRAIALTFDDGPSESTPELLEILAGYERPRHSFSAERTSGVCPKSRGKSRIGGHEIGNHTDTHPMLYSKSREFIRRELGRAQETIEKRHRHPAAILPRAVRRPLVRIAGSSAASGPHGSDVDHHRAGLETAGAARDLADIGRRGKWRDPVPA